MMVRALGRLALPALLALTLSPAADGGPISVAENSDGTSGALALYGDVAVRITSASFQASDSSLSAVLSGNTTSSAAPSGELAGSSVITIGNNVIDIHYFTGAGPSFSTATLPGPDPQLPGSSVIAMGDNTGAESLSTGDDGSPRATPNPEPAGIILFCLGAVGMATYGWRVRRQCAHI